MTPIGLSLHRHSYRRQSSINAAYCVKATHPQGNQKVSSCGCLTTIADSTGRGIKFLGNSAKESAFEPCAWERLPPGIYKGINNRARPARQQNASKIPPPSAETVQPAPQIDLPPHAACQTAGKGEKNVCRPFP
jgi:hypothetical protein